MHWLAVHFPSLYLDSLCEAEPETDAHSVAKVVVDRDRSVIQLNAQAAAGGIQLGMRLGTATAMVEDLHFFELNSSFECKKLHELALQCYALSGDVVVREEHRCLLLEFGSMLKLYTDAPTFLECVLSTLALHKLNVRYGIAASALCAELLARYQTLFDTPCVDVAQAKSMLSCLPSGCLDLPDRITQKFERLGLSEVGDVLQLPAAELAMRVGDDVVTYLQQLQSNQNMLLPRFVPPEHFSVTLHFEAEVHSASALLFPARRLLEQLEHFLLQRCKTIQVLECLLFTRSHAIQRIRLVSAQSETRALVWHDLLRLKCEYLQLTAPALGMELYAETLLSLDVDVQDLFEQGAPRHSVATTLSRITARLGHACLVQPVPENTHVPERSVAYSGFESIKHLQKQWQVAEPMRDYAQTTLRPSMLLAEPEPLSETVRIIHGPERIQSAWWQEQPVLRDYFVALNEHKQLLWVFRDKEQRWFVHGLFA